MLLIVGSDPRTGKILQGRYKIAEPLAEGGMGIVYRAERVGIGRPVVVKFLHTVLSDTPGIVDRFEREARATALLNHPNCVALVDYGLEDGAPYLVMEYVEGKTLADLLDFGALSPRRSVHIAKQVLAGLHHAHDRGILHRDLKPANIMIIDTVGFKDHVKILDFGLAKLVGTVDGKRDVTVQGIAIGTPGYMSPEQAAGLPSDRRADLYCTGALLYHLVTGTKAFEGDDIHSVLRRHREETPAMPRKMTPEAGISQALEGVISRAMQREPHKRFQNAEEMIQALAATPEGKAGSGTDKVQAIRDGKTPSSSDSATRAEQPQSRRGQKADVRRSGAVGLVVGALVGAGALAAAVMFTPLGGQLVGAGSANKANATTKPVEPKKAEPQVKVEPKKAEPQVKVEPKVEPEVKPELKEPAVPVIDLPSSPPQTDPALAKQIEEADEPPAGVDDGSKDDAKNPPAEPIGVPPLPAPAVKSIADVRAMLKKDDRDGALAGLYRLRRSRPAPTGAKAAEIARLIGHIYYDRKWWTDALKEYRFACTKDSRCRADSALVGNTVKMLAADATFWRARKIITDHLGKAALPALRSAAKNGTGDLKRRAQRVLEHTSRRARR
jgi:eukaryotic-like serine/threonine-protein kinase